MNNCSFFTHHGHILYPLVHHSSLTIRDMSTQLGITERFVQRILHKGEEAGFVEVSKDERTDQYLLCQEKNLSHFLEKNFQLSDLIKLFSSHQ